MKMKITVRIILLLICLFFIFSAYNQSKKDAIKAEKNAEAQRIVNSIINVIDRNAYAARHSTQIIPLITGAYRTNFLANQYIAELQKIDTSACPKEFQLTWLNYVHACESEAEQTPGTRLREASLGAIGIMTRSDTLEKIGTRRNEVENATTLAWQNVETVALKYNVRVQYQ
jgi:hypothetical protein